MLTLIVLVVLISCIMKKKAAETTPPVPTAALEPAQARPPSLWKQRAAKLAVKGAVKLLARSMK